MSQEAFIVGTRKKYRFKTEQGNLRIEELWSLDLDVLDKLAISFDTEINANEGAKKSFVKTKRTPSNTDLKNKLAIVTTIIDTIIEEREVAENKASKAARRAELVAQIEIKKREADGLKTQEELEQELAKLDSE